MVKYDILYTLLTELKNAKYKITEKKSLFSFFLNKVLT